MFIFIFIGDKNLSIYFNFYTFLVTIIFPVFLYMNEKYLSLVFFIYITNKYLSNIFFRDF